MLLGEELLCGIEQYGRWSMQEFVARSREMMDVVTYLRAERTLEMFKAMSFVTVDSVHFTRRINLSANFDAAREKTQHLEEEIEDYVSTDFKVHLEEG